MNKNFIFNTETQRHGGTENSNPKSAASVSLRLCASVLKTFSKEVSDA